MPLEAVLSLTTEIKDLTTIRHLITARTLAIDLLLSGPSFGADAPVAEASAWLFLAQFEVQDVDLCRGEDDKPDVLKALAYCVAAGRAIERIPVTEKYKRVRWFRMMKWEGLLGIVREAWDEYEDGVEDGVVEREKLTEVMGRTRLDDYGQMDGAEDLRKILEKMELGEDDRQTGAGDARKRVKGETSEQLDNLPSAAVKG